MIKTRQDFKYYLKVDGERNGYNSALKYFIALMANVETACMYQYLRIMRHREFYTNNSKNNPLYKFLSYYYHFRQNKLGIRYGVRIGINMVGPGLRIPHGGGIVVNCIRMGSNCSVTTGVVIGNKDNQSNRAMIGNNVAVLLGAKVIGKLFVGDNSSIAPNSVVIKDVPANSIVGGIPAKILKMKL